MRSYSPHTIRSLIPATIFMLLTTFIFRVFLLPEYENNSSALHNDASKDKVGFHSGAEVTGSKAVSLTIQPPVKGNLAMKKKDDRYHHTEEVASPKDNGSRENRTMPPSSKFQFIHQNFDYPNVIYGHIHMVRVCNILCTIISYRSDTVLSFI